MPPRDSRHGPQRTCRPEHAFDPVGPEPRRDGGDDQRRHDQDQATSFGRSPSRGLDEGPSWQGRSAACRAHRRGWRGSKGAAASCARSARPSSAPTNAAADGDDQARPARKHPRGRSEQEILQPPPADPRSSSLDSRSAADPRARKKGPTAPRPWPASSASRVARAIHSPAKDPRRPKAPIPSAARPGCAPRRQAPPLKQENARPTPAGSHAPPASETSARLCAEQESGPGPPRQSQSAPRRSSPSAAFFSLPQHVRDREKASDMGGFMPPVQRNAGRDGVAVPAGTP